MQGYDILTRALAEIAEEQEGSFWKEMPDEEEHVFSDKFNKKMDKLIRRRSKSYYELICTAGRRAACTAAAFVIIAAGTLSVKACREALYKFAVSVFGDHDEIVVENTEDASYPAGIEQVYELAELPEGFVLDSQNVTDSNVFTAYMGGEKYIIITQLTIDSYKTDIDNEHSGFEELKNSDGSKFMLNHDETDDTYTAIWNNGSYVFEIRSNLDKETVVDLCNETKFVKK